MPALSVCLQVANIAKASGVPYVEKLAKVAVAVFELLEKKGKNKKDAKELSESIGNTIIVIDTLVGMHGECAAPYFEDLWWRNGRWKHRGIKGIFNVDEFRDAIQVYRKCVDDLKIDFLIHLMGDCFSEVIQVHIVVQDLKDGAVGRFTDLVEPTSDEIMIRITKSTLFFLA